MYEFLCKCDDCLELYLQVDPGLGLLTDAYFEDENYKEALHQTNEEPLEEITSENADNEFMSYMAGKFKERLGRDITSVRNHGHVREVRKAQGSVGFTHHAERQD
eukprot:GABU01006446.1.p1 GENE.GABU01006446.1~~GABU01006446.1.p1  ORF type:complete len:113 (+),score=29.10 GABU01006446.1:25-339(+)